MKTTVSEPQAWQRVIDIEIPDEDVQKEFDSKMNKYKRKVKLPGFRPGKVPSNIIKTRFGAVIRAEIIDELINKSYRQACTENEILPVNEAKISDMKSEEGKPVSFKAEVEVDPKIEISGYKKLKIKVVSGKVKDSNVENTLNDLRERMAEVKDVDRASKKGDLVSIEYVNAMVDGEPRADLKSPLYPIEIGKGTLKDFDKGLLGLSTGEEKELTVKFPKEYHIQDIAGKSVDLTVKVNKVQEKNIPEINEEFCKKVGNFADIDALKKAILDDLEAQEKERARTEAHDKAIDALIEHNKFEVPPSRVEFYLDKVMEEQARHYPQGKGPDREEVDNRFRDVGVRAIKRYRIIDYIAAREKIKATQEEVDKKIKLIAAQYNKPFEEVKAAMRKNGTTTRIREETREQKTLDALIGEVQWEDGK